MKKRYLLLVLPLALIAGLAVLTAGASARPTYNNACSDCHLAQSGVSVSVTESATQPADPNLVTYSVSGSSINGGVQGFGVFKAGTKVAGQTGAGTFTVARDGSTYTVYWVDKDPSSFNGYAATTVTAPVASTTTTVAAPSTTVPPSTTLPPTTSTTQQQTTTTLPQPTTTVPPVGTTSTLAPPTTVVSGGEDEDDHDGRGEGHYKSPHDRRYHRYEHAHNLPARGLQGLSRAMERIGLHF